MAKYIGLMSGTSMDGIDAALVDESNWELIAGITVPYSQALKQEVLQAVSSGCALPKLSELNQRIGREFANAALTLMQANHCSANEIKAIGSHGQTLVHDTSGNFPHTVQLGCAHTIAEITGIDVVADFRSRDIVLGGQGAPLAPLFHERLFAKLPRPLAIINLGGLANVTFLQENKPAFGYDTGPGNCLMDAWIARHQAKGFDKDGEFAARGHLNQALLAELMKDAYFKKSPPKSVGKEYFSLIWLQQHLDFFPDLSAEDVQHTLLHLTLELIAECVNKQRPELVLLCGGGARNKLLLCKLQQRLRGVETASTDAYGVNPDFIEAQMMAWLAKKAIAREVLNLPPITGAAKAAVAGVIYPA